MMETLEALTRTADTLGEHVAQEQESHKRELSAKTQEVGAAFLWRAQVPALAAAAVLCSARAPVLCACSRAPARAPELCACSPAFVLAAKLGSVLLWWIDGVWLIHMAVKGWSLNETKPAGHTTAQRQQVLVRVWMWHACICGHLSVRMLVYVYVRACVCLCVCTCECMCMYVCACVCMHMHVLYTLTCNTCRPCKPRAWSRVQPRWPCSALPLRCAIRRAGAHGWPAGARSHGGLLSHAGLMVCQGTCVRACTRARRPKC